MKIFCVLFLSLCLTACSLFSAQKVEPLNTYHLTSVSSTKYPHKKNKITLLVNMPIADPGYQTEDMVYVEMNNAYQLKTFSRNRWIAPPATMLLPLLVQSLNNTQAFHAVIASPSASANDQHLDVRLLAFQQEFFTQNSQVKVDVQATLVDSNTSKVITTRRFVVVVPALHPDPASGVYAANKAVQQILEKIVRFCV